MKKKLLSTAVFILMLAGVVWGAQLVIDTVGTYDTPQKMMQAADDNFDELYGMVDQDVTSGSSPTLDGTNFSGIPLETGTEGTVANLMTALSDEGAYAPTLLGFADVAALGDALWADLAAGDIPDLSATYEAANADITKTDEVETITANWVNTANPWADNEVADDITLTNLSQVTNKAITTLSATNWRVFYSADGSIPVELALGADGTYLKSNGAAVAPGWATPEGSGDVSKVGTPADSQVGVWTGDGTIEGAASFTYDGSNLQLTGDIGSTGTRITKGWYTDLQVTNAIAGSVTGNAATATAAAAQAITDNAIVTVDDAGPPENGQVAVFTASGIEGHASVTDTELAYINGLDQALATTDSPTFASMTITPAEDPLITLNASDADDTDWTIGTNADAGASSDDNLEFRTSATPGTSVLAFLEPDTGDFKVNGSVYILEQADAGADVEAYGQIWINTATPNELWFTDDAGTDTQLGISGSDDQTLAEVLGEGADANDVDTTSWGKMEGFDSGLYLDWDADGVIDLTSDGTLELHSADWDIGATGIATGFGNITSDGVVTSTGFTIGDAAITEAELELLDGETDLATQAELNTAAALVDTDDEIIAIINDSPSTQVGVPGGGTGASTLTDGGILLGSGTGVITALGVATNGQIPIGDGTTDPVLATLTGTANEVTVTNGAGTITLSIPDSPVFVTPTLGTATATSVTSNLILDDEDSLEIMADADGMDDDEYNGITITGRNCGEGLTQWDTVRIANDADPWHQADADAAGEFPAQGITVAACTDTNEAKILVRGVVRNEGWTGLTIGGAVYLSDTAGGVTQTAPSTSGDCVQIVGWALSDSEILFDFSRPYQEVE